MNIYIVRIFVNIIGVVMMGIQWNREEFMRGLLWVCNWKIVKKYSFLQLEPAFYYVSPLGYLGIQRIPKCLQISKIPKDIQINFTPDEVLDNMKFQIENSALLNSRFIFYEFLYLDINFHQLNLTKGSSYLPLPDWLARKKAIVHPHNGDEECFKWSVIAAENVGMKDPQRVSNLRKFTDNYDWSGVEFPVSIKDIGKFETRNNVSVNILAVKGRDIYIHRKGRRMGPAGPGSRTNPMGQEINLLMVYEDGIRHYTAIKSLSRLLSGKNSNTKHKQHFCMNCLQGFTQESRRDQHRVYCEDNKSVRVEMPKQGSTIEFKDGQNQFKVPFIMYADFESILEPKAHRAQGCSATPLSLLIPITINLIPMKLINTHHLVGVFIANLLTETLIIR